MVECKWCGDYFTKTTSEVNRTTKRGGNHFCSTSCSASYGNSLRPTGMSVNALSKRAREAYTGEWVCLDCGASSDVDIHHHNRDKTNNSDDNLKALCRSCHILRHMNENRLARLTT